MLLRDSASLAPPGEYDRTVRALRRCELASKIASVTWRVVQFFRGRATPVSEQSCALFCATLRQSRARTRATKSRDKIAGVTSVLGYLAAVRGHICWFIAIVRA